MPRGIDITGQGVSFMLSLKLDEFQSEVRQATSGFEDMEKSFGSMKETLLSGMQALTEVSRELTESLREAATAMLTPEQMRERLEFLEEELRLQDRYRKGLSDVEKETDDLGNATRRWKEELRASHKASDSLLQVMGKLKGLAGAIGITIGVKEAAEQLVELESTAFNIRQIAGDTGRSVHEINRESINLSEKSVDTVENVQQTLQALTRQGIVTKEEWEGLVPIIQQAGLAQRTSATDIANTIGELKRVFSFTTDQAKELVETLSTLQDVKMFGSGSFQKDLQNLGALKSSVLGLTHAMRQAGMDSEQIKRAQVDVMKDALQMQRLLASKGMGGEAAAEMTRRAIELPTEWLSDRNIKLLTSARVADVDVLGAKSRAAKGDLSAMIGLYEKVLKLMDRGGLAQFPREQFEDLIGGAIPDPRAALEAMREVRRMFDEGKSYRELNLEGNVARRFEEYLTTIEGHMHKLDTNASRIKSRLALMFRPFAVGALEAINVVVSAFDTGSKKLLAWFDGMSAKSEGFTEKIEKASKALLVGFGGTALMKAGRDLFAMGRLYNRTLYGKREEARVTAPTEPPREPLRTRFMNAMPAPVRVIARGIGAVERFVERRVAGAASGLATGAMFGLWGAGESLATGEERGLTRPQMYGEAAGRMGLPMIGGALGGLVAGPFGAMIGAGIASTFGDEQAAEFGRAMGDRFTTIAGDSTGEKIANLLIEQAPIIGRGIAGSVKDFLFGKDATNKDIDDKLSSWTGGIIRAGPALGPDMFLADRSRGIQDALGQIDPREIFQFKQELVEDDKAALEKFKDDLQGLDQYYYGERADKIELFKRELRDRFEEALKHQARRSEKARRKWGDDAVPDMTSEETWGRFHEEVERLYNAAPKSPLDRTTASRNLSEEASGPPARGVAPGPPARSSSARDVAEGNQVVVAAVRDLKETLVQEIKTDRAQRERAYQFTGGNDLFHFPAPASRNFSNRNLMGV